MEQGEPGTDPFADLAAFAALPRVTGLALSADGSRLVASVQRPDAAGARYTSALWEIPTGAAGVPTRLTRSEQGETAPAFGPGNALLFVSSRPRPEGAGGTGGTGGAADSGDTAIWRLPDSGEPVLVAARAGGLGIAAVARGTGTIVAGGSVLAWTPPGGDDAARRRERRERSVTAILHTGMPIRYWDHELGESSPRLLCLDRGTDGGQPRDLTPDAGQALHETSATISADGRTLITSWRTARARGRFDSSLVRIDVASGERAVLADEDGISFVRPVLSADGRLLAVLRQDEGEFGRPLSVRLQLRDLAAGSVADLELGDLHPGEWAFAAEARTLFVAGDLHGRGAVVAVDTAGGAIVRRLARDASYSNLLPLPDGTGLYALRSAVDEAPVPVRLDAAATDQDPVRLPTPAPTPPLPGRLVELDVPTEGGGRADGRADGRGAVHAWLCLPHGAADRAPLMLWVHGGPFSSFNSWSWRWNPWVAVARGYAVLMPDPALSTGYGPDWIARAWPHRAAPVWRDLEAALEQVLARPEIDAGSTACLGASFGGYMTNWIAGHTDRFAAIVTHAGLWALDQQHTTTDGAQWKTGLFGTPAEHPCWYAENSPHHFVDRITTPMLVIHGNRDYRVPISEALRLWWDLARHHTGEPDGFAHRFLQLPGENHWVLAPAHARLWYETVLAFCDQHVRGLPFVPPELL